MKQTTIISKKPITLEWAAKVVELEKNISRAVELFGYNLEKHTLTLKPCLFNRYVVYMDDKYFGVWDCKRNTFVD